MAESHTSTGGRPINSIESTQEKIRIFIDNYQDIENIMKKSIFGAAPSVGCGDQLQNPGLIQSQRPPDNHWTNISPACQRHGTSRATP
jgi:hypothetical protein